VPLEYKYAYKMSGKRHGKKALLVAFEEQDDSIDEAKVSAGWSSLEQVRVCINNRCVEQFARLVVRRGVAPARLNVLSLTSR
jgi:hypothetical protein